MSDSNGNLVVSLDLKIVDGKPDWGAGYTVTTPYDPNYREHVASLADLHTIEDGLFATLRKAGIDPVSLGE